MNVCATQATKAMIETLIIQAGKTPWKTWKPDRTDGRLQSASRQNSQNVVIVPTYFVSPNAIRLLKRA